MAVDDLAVYATGGRNWSRHVVQVIEVRKKVKVQTVRSRPPRVSNPLLMDPDKAYWVEATSLFLVEKFKEK